MAGIKNRGNVPPAPSPSRPIRVEAVIGLVVKKELWREDMY